MRSCNAADTSQQPVSTLNNAMIRSGGWRERDAAKPCGSLRNRTPRAARGWPRVAPVPGARWGLDRPVRPGGGLQGWGKGGEGWLGLGVTGAGGAAQRRDGVRCGGTVREPVCVHRTLGVGATRRRGEEPPAWRHAAGGGGLGVQAIARVQHT